MHIWRYGLDTTKKKKNESKDHTPLPVRIVYHIKRGLQCLRWPILFNLLINYNMTQKTKVLKGSDYTEHVGKECIVNAATFNNIPGKILEYILDKNQGPKYLIELSSPYLNKKSGKTTNLCRVNCTQVWI